MPVNDRLYRSVDDRVLAGVCAGLADRLDMDPALVRIAYAILALLSGVFPLLVLYVIMIVVIPEEPGWTGVRPVGPPATGPAWPPAGPPAASAPADGAAPAAGATGADGAPSGTSGQAAPPPAGAVPGWFPPGAPGAWDDGSWRGHRGAERAARRAERAARRAERRSDPFLAIIVGLFLVALGAFFLLRRTFDIDWAVVWPAALLALGVVVLVAAIRPRSG
jgi:phage shock protein PspC (stress-responsive transcriptional regulator)